MDVPCPAHSNADLREMISRSSDEHLAEARSVIKATFS